MKSILFTNVRDESNIVEWVAHHFNIGFSYICIYDHLSVIPVSTLFKNNKKLIIKSILDVGDKTKLILKSVESAIKHNFDWMMYLDADEFLVLPNHNTVETFLMDYQLYNQIGINWLMFGSNFHNIKTKGTIIETYTRCNLILDQHIKSFVKPSKVLQVLNAHVYHVENYESTSIGVDYKPLNTVNKHLFKSSNNQVNNSSFLSLNAFISHYYTQDYETYHERKIRYPPDDINCKERKIFTENELHEFSNNIVFEYVYQKYNDRNKLRMKHIQNINK
jgi:hypothetical protein